MINIYRDEIQGAVRCLIKLGVSRTAALRTWDCRYRQSFRGAGGADWSIADAVYWKHPRNAGQLVARQLLSGRTWNEFANRQWWKWASASEKIRVGRVLSERIAHRRRRDSGTLMRYRDDHVGFCRDALSINIYNAQADLLVKYQYNPLLLWNHCRAKSCPP